MPVPCSPPITSSASQIFTPAVLEELNTRGQTIYVQIGVRRISNASYLSTVPPFEQVMVTIPEKLESVETFQFLGFRRPVAEHIAASYHRVKCYAQNNDIGHASLFYAVKNYINAIVGEADCVGPEADWERMLNAIGLGRSFILRLLDSGFEVCRRRKSLKEWVLEMVRIRLEFLENFERIILHHNLLPLFSEHQPKPGDGLSPQLISFPKEGSRESISQHIPDHTLFYHAAPLARLNQIFGPASNSSSTLNLRKLVSESPTDFCPFTSALYLTTSIALARHQASVLAHLIDGDTVPIAILTLAIPDSLVQNKYRVKSAEWKLLIWANRKRQVNDETLDTLDRLATYDWICGPICPQGNALIQSFKTEEGIERLEVDGDIVEQWALNNMRMIGRLERECMGKVGITHYNQTMKRLGGFE